VTVHAARCSFQSFKNRLPDSYRATHFEIQTCTHLSTTNRQKQPSITITSLLRGGAPHRAPPSVRTFASAVNIVQTQAPSDLVVCRPHTQPTTTLPRNHTTHLPLYTPYFESTTVNMSSTSNHPHTYKHVLLMVLPEHAHNMNLGNPEAASRAIRSLRSSLCPNYPHPNKYWALLWTPPLVMDSKLLWSSRPPGQLLTLGRPTTSRPV
jgi:hypothetical protein